MLCREAWLKTDKQTRTHNRMALVLGVNFGNMWTGGVMQMKSLVEQEEEGFERSCIEEDNERLQEEESVTHTVHCASSSRGSAFNGQ